MSCLLAVTTDFPDCSARRTHSPAGSRPPMSSTTISASEERTPAMSSVQWMFFETQSTCLRLTPRLQMWVRRKPAGGCSVRMRATELPTVPKPRMATFRDFCDCAELLRGGAGESSWVAGFKGSAPAGWRPSFPQAKTCCRRGLSAVTSSIYRRSYGDGVHPRLSPVVSDSGEMLKRSPGRNVRADDAPLGARHFLSPQS